MCGTDVSDALTWSHRPSGNDQLDPLPPSLTTPTPSLTPLDLPKRSFFLNHWKFVASLHWKICWFRWSQNAGAFCICQKERCLDPTHISWLCAFIDYAFNQGASETIDRLPASLACGSEQVGWGPWLADYDYSIFESQIHIHSSSFVKAQAWIRQNS